MSPGQLDRHSLRRHLLALDRALTQLKGHAGQSVQALIDDGDQRWAVERGLQLCTQCVLDIATHVVASAGHDAPDYASAIDELGKLGVIPAELAQRLRPLAGFRNALVHGYLDIEAERLHQVLNCHLGEVCQFVHCIEQYLADNP
jgi:uncharacterized protein YutE (UPF0331/DUF86 family)